MYYNYKLDVNIFKMLIKKYRKARRKTDYSHQKNTDNTWINKTEITRKPKWEEKQLYGRFKRLTGDVSHEKTGTLLRKGNLVRETESQLIASLNTAIRTNCIKARIDKTQQNGRCRLCGDRDETVNNIINECSKLAQKEYKTWHDWVGKVIHWELCKKFKFDHVNKWYMLTPESVLENETRKLLWDFGIQTYHLILSRRPELKIINNKKRELAELWAVPSDLWVKLKEVKKRNKYVDFAGKWKNGGTWKCPVIPVVSGALATNLKRLAVTQTSMENLQLSQVWKALKWVK